MMRIDAMVFSSYTILYTCIYAFRAGGLAITVLIIDSCFTWCFSILILFIQIRYSPLDIVYIYGIMRCCDIVKMIIALVIYYRGKWVRNLASSINKAYPESLSAINMPQVKDEVKIANF